MPRYYTYLISSLPLLQFGMKPPFSYQRFLQICQEKIPVQEMSILERITITGDYPFADVPLSTLHKWRIFDTALRNELVRIRAARLGRGEEDYLRQQGHTEPAISRIAMNAHRNPSILEAERMLDEERWRLLDALSVGHYFDLDLLVIYAIKLLILQRWQRIRATDSAGAIETALTP